MLKEPLLFLCMCGLCRIGMRFLDLSGRTGSAYVILLKFSTVRCFAVENPF